ncbi:MAG: TonB-dependent receptor [Rhodothermales bacterium]|nr:TonB-dependent receptor [Rhodothermales bacterium]
MKLILRVSSFCAVLFLITGLSFAQNASVSGLITDAGSGEALPGANIKISFPGDVSIVAGGVSNIDGVFSIANIPAGTYTMTASFVGYSENSITVTLSAGQNLSQDFQLSQGLELDAVIVTGTAEPQKVLDAPASISVLDAETLESEVALSSSSATRNTVGVDLAQTGVDRVEIVLRGFNNAFSGATYVLTDNRVAASPSLGVNIYSIMPNIGIDLNRVEIVRGPGSALYGAGVDAGVVHFITKDALTEPGTTISVIGGEQTLFGADFRHAGKVNQFGYKVTGTYGQADDWALSVDNDTDAAELADDFTYTDPSDAPSNQVVDAATGKLQRNYDYKKLNVNGQLEYQVNDRTKVILNGGHSRYDAVVLSGIGTLQADDFGYSYVQGRVLSGGYFGQVYFNRNNAGDSYVYGTGQNVVDKSTLLTAQSQYSFDVSNGRHTVILGADVDVTTPDTDETIYGRNENDAQITEYGAYGQSILSLTNKLDLTLAARGDYNNVVEEFQISPRAALVFKPQPGHSLRASYNRAFSSPGNNSLFLDIEARRIGFPTGQSLVFQGRGSRDGFTFDNFRQTGTALYSLPGPVFGAPFPVTNMPVAPTYGVVAAELVPALLSGAPIEGVTFPQPVRDALANLIGYTASQGTAGAATTVGVLGIPDENEESGVRPVLGPTDILPLKQTTSQVLEAGYKALINNKVLVAVDAYYVKKKDFVGPLTVESPLVFLANLGQDLGLALGAAFAAGDDPTINAILSDIQNNFGIPPEQVAGIVAALVQGGLGSNPAAVVQPDQAVLPDGSTNEVGAFLGYRNFGELDYYGVDASLQVLASESITLFGNLSVVNDDFFDAEELGEDGSQVSVALNASKFKTKVGGQYKHSSGFSVNASGRYQDAFPVQSGPYVGTVPSYFLLDVGVGFDFAQYAPGLRMDVSVQNILNEEHREFVGAPQLGRLGMARLTYKIPG